MRTYMKKKYNENAEIMSAKRLLNHYRKKYIDDEEGQKILNNNELELIEKLKQIKKLHFIRKSENI